MRFASDSRPAVHRDPITVPSTVGHLMMPLNFLRMAARHGVACFDLARQCHAIGMVLAMAITPVLSPAQTTNDAPLTAAAVRAARARSNAAIAAHDTAALVALASLSYHSVSSRNVHTNGRAGVGAQYGGTFAALPDVLYVRTPQEVRVYAPWAMADERGTWVGTWTEPDGGVTIRGRYTAKWRRIDGVWLLEAEVFTPLTCRGSSYCTRPPDQPK